MLVFIYLGFAFISMEQNIFYFPSSSAPSSDFRLTTQFISHFPSRTSPMTEFANVGAHCALPDCRTKGNGENG